MGDFDTEKKIQLELYKGIAADASLTNDQKEEKHEKIYNATWNETTHDDLYEGYHDYFTKTKEIPNPAYLMEAYTVTDGTGTTYPINANKLAYSRPNG